MTTELRAVNYPFYNREKSPFTYSFDGWRVAIVLDAGEGSRAGTVYLPAKLQVVKVDPEILASRAKPVKLGVAFQRETIARKARCLRLGGVSYDRKATVHVLKLLGAGVRAVQEAATPNAPPPPKELTLTVDEAMEIRKTQRLFFKRLGIPMAADSKPKRMADIKVTVGKAGQRVEQFQMNF